MLKNKFWKNKRILITGHTGFIGTWLTSNFIEKKCKLFGISLPLKRKENAFFIKSGIDKEITNYYFDIKNKNTLDKTLKLIKPEIVIHLAAQSIVSESYKNYHSTFETNTFGTLNLLEFIKKINSVKNVIIFTTDKVYENDDKKRKFIETDKLGGFDPYSASKAASEIICNSYYLSDFRKKNISLITLRAGNILGGGDWKENRIIPDLIKFNFENKKITIRSPKSVRPWQHVLDIVSCISFIVHKSYKKSKYSGAYNIAPLNEKNFIDVEKLISRTGLKIPQIKKSKLIEKKYLLLDANKIFKIFKFKNKFKINQTIKLTIQWYKEFYKNKNVKELIVKDLKKI